MNAVAIEPVPSPVEQEIQYIRALLKNNQFETAHAAAQALIVRFPENRDALYCAARSLRFLGRAQEALAVLQRLEQVHPNYSLLYEERGQCYVALRDAARAIDALLRAVNINNALPQSWNLLEGLYRMRGDNANVAMAAAHVATLKRLAPEVVRATSLFADGEWQLAENIIRPYLLHVGNEVEGMRLLARIGMAREVFDDAELLLDAVLTLAPDYQAARQDYARTLFERHKYPQACVELEKLLKIAPLNRDYRALYASASIGLGQHERAIELFRELLSEVPDATDLHLSLAHSLKTQGKQVEAIESYRAAAAIRPEFGDAYWSLANLKTYRFSDDELARMHAGEAAPATQSVDRYHLSFALGKAYEDRGEYTRSWQHYERGNAAKRAESRYRAEIIETNTRLQKHVCTREFFDARKGVGDARADPIFVVGLPRSGSTLLEQILASHSQVEGTQELADIQRIVHELQGRDANLDDPRYPGALADLPHEEFTKLGARYLDDTRIYRANKPFFIDKMPNNFRHIGLIHLILPNAKIIDARREPMACCFSNFKQLFASGQEFTYSIDDIARYYRTYLNLMEHWDLALPGRVLRVRHEDVIDDLEGSVRRILDYCSLDYEPACLAFHRTERSVRTASSEQVRQPIFRDGLDQWKNYEPWLEPLREALGDAITRYRGR
jgi:tetratricopeptide (TPR) repeat protein